MSVLGKLKLKRKPKKFNYEEYKKESDKLSGEIKEWQLKKYGPPDPDLENLDKYKKQIRIKDDIFISCWGGRADPEGGWPVTYHIKDINGTLTKINYLGGDYKLLSDESLLIMEPVLPALYSQRSHAYAQSSGKTKDPNFSGAIMYIYNIAAQIIPETTFHKLGEFENNSNGVPVAAFEANLSYLDEDFDKLGEDTYLLGKISKTGDLVGPIIHTETEKQYPTDSEDFSFNNLVEEIKKDTIIRRDTLEDKRTEHIGKNK